MCISPTSVDAFLGASGPRGREVAFGALLLEPPPGPGGGLWLAVKGRQREGIITWVPRSIPVRLFVRSRLTRDQVANDPNMPRVPPPEVIAAWPAPNLANPERRGPAKTIVTVIFWAVAAAILVLRLYTRRYVSKHVGLDDLLVAAAFVPATAFSVVGIVVEYEFGWDRHIWDLSVEWITKGLQLRYVLQETLTPKPPSKGRCRKLRHFHRQPHQLRPLQPRNNLHEAVHPRPNLPPNRLDVDPPPPRRHRPHSPQPARHAHLPPPPLPPMPALLRLLDPLPCPDPTPLPQRGAHAAQLRVLEHRHGRRARGSAHGHRPPLAVPPAAADGGRRGLICDGVAS